MSTEQDLLNRVLAAVGALPGVLAWRNNTGALRDVNGRMGRFGMKGSPDVLVIAGGRFVGIECKTRTGRQSEDQKRWQRACEAAGGVYVLARDVDAPVRAVRDAMLLGNLERGTVDVRVVARNAQRAIDVLPGATVCPLVVNAEPGGIGLVDGTGWDLWNK